MSTQDDMSEERKGDDPMTTEPVTPSPARADDPAPDDLAYEAWVLLANGRSFDPAFDDDWDAARTRWRDRFHATLAAPSSSGEAQRVEEPSAVMCRTCRTVWLVDADTTCTCAHGDPNYEDWTVLS